MSAPSHVPIQPLGSMLGILTATLLWGVHVTQVNQYFLMFPNDTKWNKMLVAWMLLLASAQIAINWACMFHFFYAPSPSVWHSNYLPFTIENALLPTMSATAQWFFGRRVGHLLGFKTVVNIALCVLVPLNWSLGIGSAVLTYQVTRHPEKASPELFKAAAAVPKAWFSTSAIIDLSITAALLYHLLRLSASFARTKHVIDKLKKLTLETVGLTHLICLVQAILLITTETRTDAFWFFTVVVIELYALSILFTLNSRASLRVYFEGSQTSIKVEDVMSATSQSARQQQQQISQTKRMPSMSTRQSAATFRTAKADEKDSSDEDLWPTDATKPVLHELV